MLNRPPSVKPRFDCTACELRKFARRPVWGVGPEIEKPLFMLVGEGPGREEDASGIPFHPEAPAGSLITGILTELGITRSEIYISNATRCLKPWNVKMKPEYISACKPHLTQEIEAVNPKYIVLAGNEALKSIIGHAGITKAHGIMQTGPDGRNYFPILHPASALPQRYPENRNKIRDALKTLLATIKERPKLDAELITVDSAEKLDQLEEELKSLPDNMPVVHDYETNSVKNPFHGIQPVVSGVGFCWDVKRAFYLPIDHGNPADVLTGKTYQRAKGLVRWYLESKLLKIAHHLKYEYNWSLGYFGVKTRPPFACTMLLSHLVDPSYGIHGLETISWKLGYGGYDWKLEKWFSDNKIAQGERNYTQVPLPILAEYCMGDAIVTLMWWKRGLKIIKKRNQLGLYFDVVCPGMVPYANMEAKGVLVDLKYMDILSSYYEGRVAKITEELIDIATKAGITISDKFKMSSPDQVGDLLTKWLGADAWKDDDGGYANNRMLEYDQDFEDFRSQIAFTEKGRLSTAKVVLQSVMATKDITPEQRSFLEKFLTFRADFKRFTTSVKGMRKHICPDGRVRTSFYYVETSRRSSSKPNLQNIPRDAMVKRVFVAAPKHLFVMNDYKNLEVRIAAGLSGDQTLIDAFLSGKDIHTYTAALAFKYDYEDMLKVMALRPEQANKAGVLKKFNAYDKARKSAKIVWWVILFGGGESKIALTTGKSLNEAAEIMEFVLGAFQGLKRLFRCLEDAALNNGYACNDFGRRRFLAGINSEKVSIQNEALRQGRNTPIQGSAADITLIAATRLTRRLEKLRLNAALEFEIHDDLTVETQYKDCYSVIVNCKKAMESVKMPSCPEMIFEAEQKIGSHLGTTRKVDAEMLELARTDPKKLYRMCREDLLLKPEDYARL